MKKTKWTHFWDMHSGGSQKLDWAHIFIEAPEEEAKVIFYNRFGRNPERVTCTCCGRDYSISEESSLRKATGFHRNCPSLEIPQDEKGLYLNDLADDWFQEHYYLDSLEELKEAEKRGFKLSEWDTRKDFKKVVPLEEYLKSKNIKVIYAKDIKPKERKGEVPEEGYVWQ